MGFLDKLFKSNFEGGDDDYDDPDESVEDEPDEDEPAATVVHEPAAPAAKPAAAPKAAPAPSPARSASKVDINGASIELKVVKPENFSVVSQIADHLLNRRTVVLNLEATSKEDKRRIIDFLSGVAYSIDGHLSKVAVNTFLIVPANVSVSGIAFDEGDNSDANADPKRVADIYED